jgi:hypothetical protein
VRVVEPAAAIPTRRARAARALRPVRSVGSYVVWRARRKGHQGALRRTPTAIHASWGARTAAATVVELDAGARVLAAR